MLAPNSAAYCILATREPWEEVHGSLKASGVGDFLQRFLAQGNMTELIADVKVVVRKEEESRRQARRQAKAAKEASALSAVQPPAAQPAASSGSDEAADSNADGTANHDAAAQSPSNDSCPDPQPGSLPEACTAADAAETPPASQLDGHGDGASPHVEEWVQPPDRDDAMSELFSESESEKSAQSPIMTPLIQNGQIATWVTEVTEPSLQHPNPHIFCLLRSAGIHPVNSILEVPCRPRGIACATSRVL